MYIFILSDYSLSVPIMATKVIIVFFIYETNVFYHNVLYFIHTGHGPRTKTLQLILINYILQFIPFQSRPS